MGDLLKGPLAPIFEDITPIATPNTPAAKATPTPKVEEKPAPKPVEKKLPPPGKAMSLGGLGISVRPKAGATPKPEVKVDNTPTKAVEEKPAPVYTNDSLSPESLRSKWLEFANGQGNMLKQTLGATIPSLVNDKEIKITLHNAFQKEKVNEVAPALIAYLRKVFSNNDLTLSIIVSETIAGAKAFTPKEKMTQMIKANPALGNLIEAFGLEME